MDDNKKSDDQVQDTSLNEDQNPVDEQDNSTPDDTAAEKTEDVSESKTELGQTDESAESEMVSENQNDNANDDESDKTTDSNNQEISESITEEESNMGNEDTLSDTSVEEPKEQFDTKPNDSAEITETDHEVVKTSEEAISEEVPKSDDNDSPSANATTESPVIAESPLAQTVKKGNGALLAVVVAIIVALALVGIGYMAFVSSNKDSSSTNQNSAQDLADSQFNDTTSPVDEMAVTEQINQIDKLQSELDSIDQQIKSEDLSDQNLGL